MAFSIIVLMNSYYVQGQIPAYVYIIEVILMFVMAEFSYQFIENPIRKKGSKHLHSTQNMSNVSSEQYSF